MEAKLSFLLLTALTLANMAYIHGKVSVVTLNLRLRQQLLSGHRECWAQVALSDNWWWLLWSTMAPSSKAECVVPVGSLVPGEREEEASSICMSHFSFYSEEPN